MTLGKPKPEKKAKKRKSPPIDKERILFERYGFVPFAYPLLPCECECDQQGHDLHHCFIGRKKGVKHFDDDRNLILVNHDEHIARKFDNQEWRKFFWKIQVRRYGLDVMMEWVNNIPEKYKSRVDWL